MVRPFNLDGLARVSGANADVIRSAAARLGDSDRRLELNLPPFGTISLRCLDVTAPCQPDKSDATWPLSRDGDEGRGGYVVLDSLAALRIVSATLGLPSPRSLRSLGAAERGIVTATIAAFLRAGARDVSIFSGFRSWRPEGLARLTIGIDFGAFFERVRVDVPPVWLPSRTGTSLVADATRRRLDILVAVQVARTTLTAADWSRARVGDAVVFDDSAALDPGRDWPLRIVCGEFSAEATLGSEGGVRMISEFSPSYDAQATTDFNNTGATRRDPMSSDDRQAASLTMLASAPIQVVAEVGRLVFRADELTTLRPGSILTIGPLRPTTVDLTVGDRKWARGELVDVDGQLGVRLTTMLTDTEPRFVSTEAATLR